MRKGRSPFCRIGEAANGSRILDFYHQWIKSNNYESNRQNLKNWSKCFESDCLHEIRTAAVGKGT
jgi:hypothetical protein